MTELVELDVPARPEYVSIARMTMSALAAIRPGIAYERVDDLRIVVSEACTAAIEAIAASGSGAARLRLRCGDEDDRLEFRILAPAGAFDRTVAPSDPTRGDDYRLSLIKALVDEAEVRPSPPGSELCLVLKREPQLDGEHTEDQTIGQG